MPHKNTIALNTQTARSLKHSQIDADPNARGTAAAAGPPDARATQPQPTQLTHEAIAARAYQCWHVRGCPNGSPDVDWQQAEQELSAPNEPAS